MDSLVWLGFAARLANLDGSFSSNLRTIGVTGRATGKTIGMQWSEPKFEEISLGCEINSYACAQL